MFMIRKKKDREDEGNQNLVSPRETQGDKDLENLQSQQESSKNPADASTPETETSGEESNELSENLKDNSALETAARFTEWAVNHNFGSPAIERAQHILNGLKLSDPNDENEEELFETLAKGADFERAIAEAYDRGEISGRNTAIDKLMAETIVGDGLPHPATGSGGLDNPQGNSIFDLAREA